MSPADFDRIDALERLVGEATRTISGTAPVLGNCNSHARLEFAAIHPAFPEECRRVLEAFGKIYRLDLEAKEQALNAEQHLDHHQKYRAPVRLELKGWLDEQVRQKQMEPNSGLGKGTIPAD